MAEKGFDISKYITAEDIVAAVAAGVVAYIRNRPKVDDQTQAAQQAAPTPKGLHDGTGKAFAAATTPTARPVIAPAKVTIGSTPGGGSTMTVDRSYLKDVMSQQGEKYSTAAARAARAAQVAARGGMKRIGNGMY